MPDSGPVKGQDALIQKLQRVRAAAQGVLTDKEVQVLLLSRVKARYIEGVDPSGRPWPGLLESTLKSKSRRGFSKPRQILYATGRLYNSIKVIQGSNIGLLAGSTGYGFRIGVADPVAAVYGRIHNYGYAGQEERRFIGLSTQDVIAVNGLLRRRLKSIAKV